jgi:hypothetical protein
MYFDTTKSNRTTPPLQKKKTWNVPHPFCLGANYPQQLRQNTVKCNRDFHNYYNHAVLITNSHVRVIYSNNTYLLYIRAMHSRVVHKQSQVYMYLWAYSLTQLASCVRLYTHRYNYTCQYLSSVNKTMTT